MYTLIMLVKIVSFKEAEECKFDILHNFLLCTSILNGITEMRTKTTAGKRCYLSWKRRWSMTPIFCSNLCPSCRKNF